MRSFGSSESARSILSVLDVSKMAHSSALAGDQEVHAIGLVRVDEHHGASARSLENLLQRGDSLAPEVPRERVGADLESADFVERERVDFARSGRRSIHGLVVHVDEDSVFGRAWIGLHEVEPHRDRRAVGRERVFGRDATEMPARTAVSGREPVFALGIPQALWTRPRRARSSRLREGSAIEEGRI